MTVFQMKNPTHEEIKKCATHHTTRTWPSWKTNPWTIPTPVISSETIPPTDFVFSGSVLGGRKDLLYVVEV